VVRGWLSKGGGAGEGIAPPATRIGRLERCITVHTLTEKLVSSSRTTNLFLSRKMGIKNEHDSKALNADLSIFNSGFYGF
jgi:hypothetical protein